MKRSAVARGILATVAFLLLAPAALGYDGQVDTHVFVASPTDDCPAPVTVQATVVDNNGAPLKDFPVSFSVGSPTAAATVSNTDANGVARFQLSSIFVGGAFVYAQAKESASSALVICEGEIGLPRTDTVAPESHSAPSMLGLALLASLLSLGLLVAARSRA